MWCLMMVRRNDIFFELFLLWSFCTKELVATDGETSLPIYLHLC